MLASCDEVAAIPGQIKDNSGWAGDPADPPRPPTFGAAVPRLVEVTELFLLWTVVMREGMDLGAKQLNAAVVPIQNDLLCALGMASMI